MIVRADLLDIAPGLDPIATVVQQMDRRHIESVNLGGRQMVRDGELVDNQNILITRLQEAVDRLGPVSRSDLLVQPWL